MKPNFIPLFILVWLIIVSGCDKRNNISTYTFQNVFAVPITLDVYQTKIDYSQNQNLLARYIISPGSDIHIPLEGQKTYWIDWYSDDYSLNNWYDQESSVSAPFPLPELNVWLDHDKFVMACPRLDRSRSVTLKGNGTGSYWRMGVTADTGLHGYYEISFNKNFEGTLKFTSDAGNKILDDDFTFQTFRLDDPNGGLNFELEILKRLDSSVASFAIGVPYPGSQDSLTLAIPKALGYRYYSLLRQ